MFLSHDIQQRPAYRQSHWPRKAGEGGRLVRNLSELEDERVGLFQQKIEIDPHRAGPARQAVLADEGFVDQDVTRETEILPQAGKQAPACPAAHRTNPDLFSFRSIRTGLEIGKDMSGVIMGLVVILPGIETTGDNLCFADLPLERIYVGGLFAP